MVDVEVNLQWIWEHAPGQADVPWTAPTETTDPPPNQPELVGLVNLPWDAWFQQWLTSLQAELPPAPAYELSLSLTNDAAIHQLNAQYRDVDQPTDVLAFAALEVDSPPLPSLPHPLDLGDIVISVETAHRQAQAQRHSLQQEIVWLATHGLLHLLGWDHPDEASLTQMLQQQQMLLVAVNVLLPLP